jgi:hypothetical protein
MTATWIDGSSVAIPVESLLINNVSLLLRNMDLASHFDQLKAREAVVSPNGRRHARSSERRDNFVDASGKAVLQELLDQTRPSYQRRSLLDTVSGRLKLRSGLVDFYN